MALEQEQEQIHKDLSDSLHQLKNPVQALRTYGKLLQRRIADDEAIRNSKANENHPGVGPLGSGGHRIPQLLELAEHLIAQSDRVAERLHPVDVLVDKLSRPAKARSRLSLLLAPATPDSYSINDVPFQTPLLPSTRNGRKKDNDDASSSSSVVLSSTTSDDTRGTDKSSLFWPLPSQREPSKLRTRQQYMMTRPPQQQRRTPVPWSVEDDNYKGSHDEQTDTEALEMTFIDDALDPILSAFRAIASDRGIHFDIFFADDLPGVMARPHALQEAVSNVLENAFKYVKLGPGAQGNEFPKVRLVVVPNRSSDLSPGVTIRVEDNGQGIPVDDVEAIFERGFRSMATKHKVDGSGIGLDIARNLVEHMGGTLRVATGSRRQNELGGAVFELILYRKRSS